jgi:3-oxoacyl-[acyl-carrier protein] reductase
MTGTLRGRVALITGASGGIGRALAARLAAAGCDLALTYARNAEPAEQAAADAREAGVRAVTLQADLGDPAAADAVAERAAAELGPVDVLVPNAGTATQADLAGADFDLWQQTLAVNLTAPHLLARAVVPGMAERGFGRVLFVSSVAAFTGGAIGPHYAASKAGLHGLTHWLAGQYAVRGVTVNAIAPALVEGTALLPPGIDPGRVPVGRLGTTAEVADLAATMLATGYLTGKVYLLDGGLHPH